MNRQPRTGKQQTEQTLGVDLELIGLTSLQTSDTTITNNESEFSIRRVVVFNQVRLATFIAPPIDGGDGRTQDAG
ncbi:MAG: hypothetical protein KDB27_18685 [Planctomycetales bacterium]|nr:hypothetical protein [Planctomycetales bacterium]